MTGIDILGALLEDLARAEDAAADGARALLADADVPTWAPSPEAVRVLRAVLVSPEQVASFAAVAQDLVHIALHSALVAIDGGSSSAEVGRVYLVGEDGVALGDGLHELFVDHLFETGRMT